VLQESVTGSPAAICPGIASAAVMARLSITGGSGGLGLEHAATASAVSILFTAALRT